MLKFINIILIVTQKEKLLGCILQIKSSFISVISFFLSLSLCVCTSPAAFSDMVAGKWVLLFLTGSQYSCYLALKREGLLSDGLNRPLCGIHPRGWESITLSALCTFLSFCCLMACHKDTKEQDESFMWPKFIVNAWTLVKVHLPENLGKKKKGTLQIQNINTKAEFSVQPAGFLHCSAAQVNSCSVCKAFMLWAILIPTSDRVMYSALSPFNGPHSICFSSPLIWIARGKNACCLIEMRFHWQDSWK